MFNSAVSVSKNNKIWAINQKVANDIENYKCGFYIWATENDIEKNLYKMGQSINGPDSRISMTGLSGRAYILAWVPSELARIDKSDQKYLHQPLHDSKKWKVQWYGRYDKKAGGTEWIKTKMDHSEFRGMIIEALNYQHTRKELKLRKIQQEFLVKSTWQEWKDFLLFAKCRVGKSIMVLSHIKERKYSISLVISLLNSPNQSWEEDCRDYDKFSNMRYINIQGKSELQAQELINNTIESYEGDDLQVILYNTLQGCYKRNYNFNIDFIGFDEVHKGGNEEDDDGDKMWSKFRAKHDCPVMKISGTAFKIADDYHPDNKFVWDYFMEQIDQMGKTKKDNPFFKLCLPQIEDDKYSELYFEGAADGIKNLFHMDEDSPTEFLYERLVNNFINGEFNRNSPIYRYGSNPKNDPYIKTKSMIVSMDSVAQCDAIAPIFEAAGWAPLVAHGSAKVDSKDIEYHLSNTKRLNVIITCSANVLGATMDVDTCVLLNNGSSEADWLQFIFRGGSKVRYPNNMMRPDWLVVDYNTCRALTVLQASKRFSEENDPQVAQYDMGDFMDLSMAMGDSMRTVSDEDIRRLVAVAPHNVMKHLASFSNSISSSTINSVDFDALLQESKEDAKAIDVDNKTEGDSAKSMVVDGVNEKKECNDEDARRAHIKEIMRRLPMTMAQMFLRGDNPNDLDDIFNHSAYSVITEDTDGVLPQLLENDYDYKMMLSRRTMKSAQDIRSAMENDRIGTIDELYTTSGNQLPIPAIIIETMLPTNA